MLAPVGPRSVLVVSALLLAGCTGGAAPTEAVPSSDGYLVAGHIVDDNQLPVAGAALDLSQRKDNAPVARTNSSQDGAFSFGRVPVGSYVVTVKAAGFESFVRSIDVMEGRQSQLAALPFILTPLPVIEPFHEGIPKRLHIQWGFAYAINGDYNQGCMRPAYTCNGIAYPPTALATFEARDPARTPWAGAVLEEWWTSTSPICAKAVAIDLYNPDAPGIFDPNRSNPHYWTNYPSTRWSSTSPIRMVIPRNATNDPEALDATWRVESNGDKMLAQGNWTLRNFPPGKGLTNLAVDVNCFTDQTFDLLWTNFYLKPPTPDFTGRQQ